MSATFDSEEIKCDYLFESFNISESCLLFFSCVHIVNVTKVTKSHRILMKLRFLKCQNIQFLRQK